MKKYTDKEIIDHLERRKSEAVSFLVEKHLPMIKFMVAEYRFSDGTLVIFGDENDAEDIFQEALYIIIKKIDTGKFILSSKFSTYLYAVCKNLLKNKLKKRLTAERYKSKEAEVSIVEEESSDIYDEDLKQKIFDHYFLQLSPVCKEILKLSWLDLSNIEIANTLGNTVKYINKRKHECKKRLIELIKNNKDNI